MLAGLVLRRERLRVTVDRGRVTLCVTLDSISVIEVFIEVIVGEIEVNNAAETSGYFCTSVGQQRFKRRGHGIKIGSRGLHVATSVLGK